MNRFNKLQLDGRTRNFNEPFIFRCEKLYQNWRENLGKISKILIRNGFKSTQKILTYFQFLIFLVKNLKQYQEEKKLKLLALSKSPQFNTF